MKYIKLFEDFNPSVIPQTEPQFTIWMMKNAPKAVTNPQEWFESEISKSNPDWVFISSIIKELSLADMLSIPKGVKNILEKTHVKEEVDSLSLLHWAVIEGNIELTKALIDAGAKIDVLDKFKQTPLHLAVIHDNLVIAEALIDAKADLNAVDNWKKTPLHWATKFDNIEIVKYLIDLGADLDIKDWEDQTPWDVARFKMRQAVPELKPNGETE